MRSVKTAIAFLLFLVCVILLNSFYIINVTRELSAQLETGAYYSVAEKFQKHERYISLTVSHDDLTNIEEGFAELIGAANAKDEERLVAVKSRLKDSLEHLGRLSGINLDSIL